MDINLQQKISIIILIAVYFIVFLYCLISLIKLVKQAVTFDYRIVVYFFVLSGCIFVIILEIIALDDIHKNSKEKHPSSFVCAGLADFFMFSSFAFILMSLHRLQLQMTTFNLEGEHQHLSKTWIFCWVGLGIFFFFLVTTVVLLMETISQKQNIYVSGIYDLGLGIFCFIVSVSAFSLGIRLNRTFPKKLKTDLSTIMRRLFWIMIINGLILLIICGICFFFSITKLMNKTKKMAWLLGNREVWIYFCAVFLEVIPTFVILILLVGRKTMNQTNNQNNDSYQTHLMSDSTTDEEFI